MVFCYKIITESPRRSLSPRKRPTTATGNVTNVSSSVSHLLSSFDYEICSDALLSCIPDREWRLLAALARKRDENVERERLADQFRKLWQKEKEEREIVEAEALDQYNRYIHEKRREERSWQEYKQYQKSVETQVKRKQLLECIKFKERRSADLLAFIEDIKASNMIDKALEEDARARLAADRRLRNDEAEEFRKHIELIEAEKKADDAKLRRSAKLKDAAQRVAISNALNSWEQNLLRAEVSAVDAARRAHHAAHAALTNARSERLQRMRDARARRARRLAYVTEQLREAIKNGRM